MQCMIQAKIPGDRLESVISEVQGDTKKLSFNWRLMNLELQQAPSLWKPCVRKRDLHGKIETSLREITMRAGGWGGGCTKQRNAIYNCLKSMDLMD